MAKHNTILLIALAFALLLAIVTPVFYIFVTRESGRKRFVAKLEYEAFAAQPTNITPSWWVHIIWEICMWLQPSWIFSSLVFVMLRDKKKDYLYKTTPTSAVMLFIIASSCQMVRYFCFGQLQLVGSFVASVIGVAAAIASLAILTTTPRDWFLHPAERQKQGNTYTVFLTRCWTINALGAYTTWFLFFLLSHFASVLVHEFAKSLDAARVAIGCLSVILLATLAYFITDLCFFDHFNRYQVSPYVFLMIGMSSVLSSPHCTQSSCIALAAVCSAQAAFGLIFKVVFLILREILDLKVPRKRIVT